MASPSPPQQHLRQQYGAPQQVLADGSARMAPAGSGGAALPSRGSSSSLPEAWVRAAPARAGPSIKTWSDEEGVLPPKDGYSFCTKFRFAIWLGVVLLLVAAAVGLSVTMAVVMHDRNKDNPAAPPPPSGGGGDEPGGGSDSGGNGNTDPLPPPDVQPDWVPSGAKAIWWDDFDGTALDTSKWSYDLGNGVWGWGNNESQTYTDSTDNVRVADGNLYITALKDGNSITSGRINTKPTASFWPGMTLRDGTGFTAIHIEARLQLPDPGQGLWPALWLFPTELTYGQWAASGEIDVMESVNNMKTITQGLHFGGADPRNVKSMKKTQQDSKQPWSGAMHVVGLDWEAGKITMSIDGQPSKTWRPREKDPEGGWWTEAAGAPADAPFNQPFYLILNLAVGGLWPDPPDNTTPFPSTYTVDYVRVWGTPL